jgi:lysophospholipase L1-like esterase
MFTKHRLLILLAIIILAFVLFAVIELLIIKYNGTAVPAPNIPRAPQSLGSGPKLTYVVMGDSTSIGQGTSYSDSYAEASAHYLARNHAVNFVNVGVSGARIKDVLDNQLPKAAAYKPNVVLIGVGANDATHFTSGSSIQSSLQKIITGLRQANCNVRIIVTGSPAVDGARRFPWPIRQLMGLRTRQVNNAFAPIITKDNLTLAPIALKTRAAFIADPTLLAADKFHPNARGYALWIPVVNNALNTALSSPTQNNTCPK